MPDERDTTDELLDDEIDIPDESDITDDEREELRDEAIDIPEDNEIAEEDRDELLEDAIDIPDESDITDDEREELLLEEFSWKTDDCCADDPPDVVALEGREEERDEPHGLTELLREDDAEDRDVEDRDEIREEEREDTVHGSIGTEEAAHAGPHCDVHSDCLSWQYVLYACGHCARFAKQKSQDSLS